MGRSLADRWREHPWRQLRDQALHVVLGALAALPAVWGPLPWLCGGSAALVVAVAREWEQRPVQSWGDTSLDVGMTLLGGVVVGLGMLAR